ncbi:uncharacterized protein LOC123556809 [Mercenaria mercenaria]|uniref:uncharacterized protein LOC123556809 n=1 Tax=Mercenaria mercenaria TaxID=6596 RepID=UPI00234EA690|nr:uncharacterized protein LOC123556809 [Mercenaria mercenaria]XP_045203729.2 uncharacterized protein LOC123556809 [Mercenaria mercenaria]
METTKAKDKIITTNKAIENPSTATKTAIKEHFGDLKKKIDQLETAFDSSVEEIKLKDETDIKPFSTEYYMLHENLQKLESDMNQKRNCNEKCILFMAVKKAEKGIVLIEKDLKTVTDGSKFVKYAFQSTNILGDMLADAGNLGSLTILDSEKNKEAKFVRSLNVKSQKDDKVCYITGVCVLSDTLLQGGYSIYSLPPKQNGGQNSKCEFFLLFIFFKDF